MASQEKVNEFLVHSFDHAFEQTMSDTLASLELPRAAIPSLIAMVKPRVRAEIAQHYGTMYTDEELGQLTELYKSPLGLKLFESLKLLNVSISKLFETAEFRAEAIEAIQKVLGEEV